MYVRNLEGDEYPLQATLTHEMELKGNQSLSAKIDSTKVNQAFINDISQMWEIVDDDDVTHKIIYLKKKGEGNQSIVNVKALPLFFDKFDVDRIYETYDEHMTAERCFGLIFANTGFTFVLVDTFYAVDWQGFGKGDTKLSLFKNAITRYKAEFRISGSTVYLESKIGRDTSFMYRHKLNASNILLETDGSEFWTYAKGFGNFKDGEEENALLLREYTSPLAAIIGIRHAPPIYDGRVKDPVVMDNALKTLVDESLKISVSADLHDLRRQGYTLAQPELGDRVFLIDERIRLNEEVRVVSTSITKDWRGNVLDLKVTFGSEELTKRYQSNLKTAIDRITEILDGKAKLPFSALDNAVLQATKALQSAQTELFFTDNGIIAQDKNNPNYLVLINSSGIGVSIDGGNTFRTAMTGEGIVADLITVGTMLFERLKGGVLTLGGPGNGNGQMVVLDANGEVIADLSASTGGFEKLYVGQISSPSIANYNRANIEMYVHATSGNDDNDGLSWSTAKQSLQNAIDSIPKLNDGAVTIYLSNEIHYGDINIEGFNGAGNVRIDFRTYTTLNGTITMQASSNYLEVANFKLNTTKNPCIAIDRCTFANVKTGEVYGGGDNNGVSVTGGSHALVSNTKFNNVARGILSQNTSHVLAYDNDGKANLYGLMAYRGGIITGFGTAPVGTTANTVVAEGGQILSTWTYPTVTPPSPPPAPGATKIWESNDHNTWTSWGAWVNDSYVKQGNWGYGRQTGFWFFPNDISSTLSGKTIKSMRVYIKRRSGGGNSGKVPVQIRWHTFADKPSGAPSDINHSNEYVSKSLAWGDKAWVSLPSSFYPYFQNGTAKGIGIYVASDAGANYAVLESSCKLEITYE
jgi:hypothetical protein